MLIAQYFDQVRAIYASGHATEHSYRPALRDLFESIVPALTVINEPKRSEGGMPDFLFNRGDIPVGWAEAKDIDKDVIRLKGYPRREVMQHIVGHSNVGLMFNRQTAKEYFSFSFVADKMINHGTFYLGNRGQDYLAPLYRYPPSDEQSDAFQDSCRVPNLDPKLYAAICTAAGIDPADQAGPDDDFRAVTGDARPSEVKVFDYIYGVLHSPDYRATYTEFLKIDFPRIPYPSSPEIFAHVSGKGEALRRLHLMEPAAIGDTPYPYHGEGDDVVAAGYPKLEGDRVHINKDQYFDNVPAVAWSFHIGGYQPAQKWLKDRRGHALSWDDIGHYQKIVKILAETDRIMQEIQLPLD